MAYANETAQKQALLDNYANNLRATLGTLACIIDEAELLQKQYNEEVSPIISSWDNADVWPNKGGLSGASIEETKSQMTTWQSYLDTLKTTLGTSDHIGQYVSAAGPENCRG